MVALLNKKKSKSSIKFQYDKKIYNNNNKLKVKKNTSPDELSRETYYIAYKIKITL
jgi:hypothetical protein